MKDIFIYGSGPLAQLAKFYFDHDSSFHVCGFVVDEAYMLEGRQYLGLPLVSTRQVEEQFPAAWYGAFVAIGYSGMNRARQSKMEELRQKGYHLVSYVASSCIRWEGTVVGENCMVMEGVVLQPFTEIQDGCIICSGAQISHDSRIGSYTYIGSNAVVAGRVTVGHNVFIGVGAAIKNDIAVSDFSLVGAGAYIARDTKPYSVYGRKHTADLLKDVTDENTRRELQVSFL